LREKSIGVGGRVRAYSYRLMVLARRGKRTADIGTQKIRNLKFVHSTVLLNLTFIKLNIIIHVVDGGECGCCRRYAAFGD